MRRERESLTLISSSGFELDSFSESTNAKEPRFVGIPFLEVDPFLMNLIFFCFEALPYKLPLLSSRSENVDERNGTLNLC